MNDLSDGPEQDLNPWLLTDKADALPTELLGWLWYLKKDEAQLRLYSLVFGDISFNQILPYNVQLVYVYTVGSKECFDVMTNVK